MLSETLMNPRKQYKATMHGRPYPAFACGCSDPAQCQCNNGVRLIISSAELLAEAERAAGEYPLRADLLLSLASCPESLLIDAMRWLAESIYSGDIEFRCSIRSLGYARCCLRNAPIKGKPKHLPDAYLARVLGVPKKPNQPAESVYVDTYMCPVCHHEDLVVWEGENAKFKTLQTKLWQIIVFDGQGSKVSVRR